MEAVQFRGQLLIYQCVLVVFEWCSEPCKHCLVTRSGASTIAITDEPSPEASLAQMLPADAPTDGIPVATGSSVAFAAGAAEQETSDAPLVPTQRSMSGLVVDRDWDPCD